MTESFPKYIYKIVDAKHWQKAQGEINLPPMPIDEADGYFHFSTHAQLAKTLELYFAGQKDVAILAVEVAPLAQKIKWEPSRGGDLFPHIYAELPMSAIVRKDFVDVDPNGQCALPSSVV